MTVAVQTAAGCQSDDSVTPAGGPVAVHDGEAAKHRVALLASLASVYVVWSSTYLVMRIAVESLPPMLMGAIRFSIAGGLLFVFGAFRRVPMPTLRQWFLALPIGILLFVGGNGLVAIGETRVSSGIAAVVCATMPLWMSVFAVLTGERPTAREWLGVALGLAGVVVLTAGAELSAEPVFAAILLGSPLAWAAGSILSRRLPAAPGVMAAASQQIMGGLALFAVGFGRGERLPAEWTFDAMWSVAYLIVFGSFVAFTAYSWLLKNARPALATSYAFVNPPLAVLLGAALGAEHVDSATLAATPLIVAAVVLVVIGKKK
jgi:drug/metabolite transporter (DMT)-like permease